MGMGPHANQAQDRAARNLRTALILAAIALAFGIGFVVRMWLTA
jgi:hypothetical protein